MALLTNEGRVVELTLFECGPSKCEHDYQEWIEIEGGATMVCAKCGARAIDEAMWA